jgi:hypothetical protein
MSKRPERIVLPTPLMETFTELLRLIGSQNCASSMFTWLPKVMGLAAAVPAARIPTAKARDLKRLVDFTVTVLVWLSDN